MGSRRIVNWAHAWALRSKGGVDGGGDDFASVLYRAETDVLVLSVADGAGSADLGGVGAEIASRTFVEVAEKFWSQERLATVLAGTALEGQIAAPEPDTGIAILRADQQAVKAEADRREVSPMLLAATLIGASFVLSAQVVNMLPARWRDAALDGLLRPAPHGPNPPRRLLRHRLPHPARTGRGRPQQSLAPKHARLRHGHQPHGRRHLDSHREETRMNLPSGSLSPRERAGVRVKQLVATNNEAQ